MANGQLSKDKIAETLAKAYPEGWLGKHDNKYYINFSEGGEKVQISITLTKVKTPIEVAENVSRPLKPLNFEDDTPPWEEPIAVKSAEPAQLTTEEEENIQTLLARLGL